MYRVLIVDDEPWALKGIRSTFKWDDLGFEVIGETTDPQAAFEMIVKEEPDVVMTDIRMPEISGIELARMSKERGVPTEFVMISGAADFHFSRESNRLGCFDYMLKPLQFDEADDMLMRLFEHLERKSRLQDRQRQYEACMLLNEETPHVRQEETEAVRSNCQFKKLLSFVDAHFMDDLSLSELSRKFFINYTYCSDLFRRTTQRTFTDYVTSLRMDMAQRLLRDKSLTVVEIGYKVGYKDYSYFNKKFKREYGITPAAYRKKGRETN